MGPGRRGIAAQTGPLFTGVCYSISLLTEPEKVLSTPEVL